MWKVSLSAIAVVAAMIAMSPSTAKSEDAPPGQKIFIKLKCNQCHSIDSLKIAKVKSAEDDEEEADEDEEKIEPSDLSGTGKEHDAAFMVKWLKKEVKLDGHKHKKKFKGSPEELQTVSDWLATLKFNVPKKKKG